MRLEGEGPAPSLAQAFRRVLHEGAQSPEPLVLSMDELLALHGQASAAVLLLMMALLSVTPVAGIGTLLSLVILLLGWRWHRDHVQTRLPRRLAEFRLGPVWSARCLRMLAWTYGLADRCLRARWLFMSHRRTRLGWGAWIAAMGLIIMLPLPLGNVLPSLSLVLLSLGWMFRDGLALLASALVGSGALVFTAAMGHAITEAAQRAWTWAVQFF
jgi:hypothetical protein